MTTQPAIFVSHGSPMFALEPGLLGPNLAQLGKAFDGVRAIVVVSPHWQTRGIHVTAAPTLETIHDFGGFPAPLYELQYPAKGDPQLAQDVVRLLADAGFAAVANDRRGLDHGAWVPLRHLRPQGDIPVLQVSMPVDLDVEGALRLGRALAPLREQDVLVIGSGSLTHNLHEFRHHINDPEYAQAFADWVGDAVARRDVAGLVEYRRRAPFATRAHPTEEHYLPLLVALGASNDADASELIEGGMTYGTLSMDSFGWGLPAIAA